MVIWPGLVPTRITEHERMHDGAPVNVTNLSCCTHVGSHVDAPFHHYVDGKTVEQVPLSRYVGAAYLADLTGVKKVIHEKDIESALEGIELPSILLLKTRNSIDTSTWKRFDTRYVHIAPDAAEEIVERGVKTIGFDHLAVEGYEAEGCPTHKILLGQADVTIVEGLDFSRVGHGYYFFSAAPLRIKGSDGSPTRAYLIEGESEKLPESTTSFEDA